MKQKLKREKYLKNNSCTPLILFINLGLVDSILVVFPDPYMVPLTQQGETKMEFTV